MRGVHDGALQLLVGRLARGFPGTSGVYVEDLVSGRGASWNARARFPAASTLKVAVAITALRWYAGKPARGSRLDSVLRRMLLESDNDAANEAEATFGGGSRVDEVLRAIGIGDTWMGGGYLHGTAYRPPIPLRVESQPSFPCCKYTTAWDLARLFGDLHLAAAGDGPLIADLGSTFTASDARYLLYLLAHVPDRGKLGRYLARRPVRADAQGGLDLVRTPRRRARLLAGRCVRRGGDDDRQRGGRVVRTCSPPGSHASALQRVERVG